LVSGRTGEGATEAVADGLRGLDNGGEAVERATDADLLRLVEWSRVAAFGAGRCSPGGTVLPGVAVAPATAGGRVRSDRVRDEVRPHPSGGGVARAAPVRWLSGGRQYVVGEARRQRPRPHQDDPRSGSGGPVLREVRHEAARCVDPLAGRLPGCVGAPWLWRSPRYDVYAVAPYSDHSGDPRPSRELERVVADVDGRSAPRGPVAARSTAVPADGGAAAGAPWNERKG